MAFTRLAYAIHEMGAVRMRHSIREFATQPVILWIPLGGKPKWLPLNFGFNDEMRTAPIKSRMKNSAITVARWHEFRCHGCAHSTPFTVDPQTSPIIGAWRACVQIHTLIV